MMASRTIFYRSDLDGPSYFLPITDERPICYFNPCQDIDNISISYFKLFHDKHMAYACHESILSCVLSQNYGKMQYYMTLRQI